MSTTIKPDVLAEFEAAELAHGPHGRTFTGQACALEWVSRLANEGFTDAPDCASLVIRSYTIRLNDRWGDEKRQSLKPYLIRMIGTGGDGKDEQRRAILCEEVAGLVVPWLRLVDLHAEADALTAAGTDTDLRRALSRAAGSAWTIRSARYVAIREAVRAELAKQGKPAADAAADAAAAVVADAAAVVAADAAADAVVAAAAAAVAAADAAAAVAAAAAAVAAADAAAAVAADPWASYFAAKKAARKVYDEAIATSTDPKWVAIRELSQAQDGAALCILDRLIEAK